jgi:hypothetical protein
MLLPTRFTGRGHAASDIIYRSLLHAFVLAIALATTAATLLK